MDQVVAKKAQAKDAEKVADDFKKAIGDTERATNDFKKVANDFKKQVADDGSVSSSNDKTAPDGKKTGFRALKFQPRLTILKQLNPLRLLKILFKQYLRLSFFNKVSVVGSIMGLNTMIILFENRLKSGQVIKLYAPTAGYPYWIYHHLTYFGHVILKMFLHIFPGKIGVLLSLVLLTALVYLLLFPLSIYQHHVIVKRKSIMDLLKPQLDDINWFLKYGRITKSQRKKLIKLRKEVYRENRLPNIWLILIVRAVLQFFVLLTLYQTVAYSSALKMDLGLISLAKQIPSLALISAILNLISILVQYFGLPSSSRKSYDWTSFVISPLSRFLSGYFLPSIIPIYWIIGQTIMIIENYLIYYRLRPYLKEHYERQKPKIKHLFMDREQLKTFLAVTD